MSEVVSETEEETMISDFHRAFIAKEPTRKLLKVWFVAKGKRVWFFVEDHGKTQTYTFSEFKTLLERTQNEVW